MPPAPPPDWVIARRREVGQRIREIRLHRNLTQEKTAERVGMDRASYNRIEQGHAAPLLDSLIMIADVLGVPLRSLFS